MPEEITTNLHTTGKEWQTEDGVEYRGAYHRYITNETYTGAAWNAKTSKKLIPYVSQDITNYTYIQLKKNLRTKYIKPQPATPTISSQDRKSGVIFRYFIKKNNEQLIIEIDKLQFDAWQSNVIDPNIYQAIQVKWYISGNVNDDTTGGVVTQGVRTKNLQQIKFYTQSMPGLDTILTDPLQYYSDDDFKAPKDINL